MSYKNEKISVNSNSGKKVNLIKHALGYYFVENMPSAEELSKYYSEKYYQNESGNYRLAYPTNELDYINSKISQKFSIISQHFGIDYKGNLLDLGCGEGFTLNYFHKKEWNVHGVDFSSFGCENMNPEMLKFVEIGNLFSIIDELISNNNKYSVIWLSNVLEHVVAPIELLTKLSKIVQPGGLLIVQVPNDFSKLQNHLMNYNLIDREFWVAIPDHLNYFDYDSMLNIAHKIGFSNPKILADFPIDWFLLNPNSNYIMDSTKGTGAHTARIEIELLINNIETDKVNSFYEALAKIGMGRQITGIFTN